jgi:PAS domain S-box-containing protein
MKISMLTTCAVLLLSSVLLIVNEVIVFRQSLIERTKVMAQTIATNSTAALTFNDQKTAEETLSALKSVPNITCAVLSNRQGVVLAKYISAVTTGDCQIRPVGPDSYYIGINYLDIVQRINLDNESIGTLYIQSDLNEIYYRIQWYVATVFMVMLLAIAIAFLLISRLQKIITKPLSDMAEAMAAISGGENYAVRVVIQSQDEVGLLGEGFNEMLSQIQKRDKELELHREHLEEMINIRTGELARTTNFLEKIFNSSLDGILTTDVHGNIMYASPRIKDILGYEQNEVLGKKIGMLWLHGLEESEKIMHELMKKGAIKAYELTALTKAGESIVLNIALSLLRDEKGKITGTTGFYRDITEEKKMIEATKQAKLRAEAANKAKSQFLAVMSHEIRTPLNGVLGMAEAFLDTVHDEEQRHIIGTITKEANSLLGIINEILDFSKIEAGKLEIDRIPFDLRNIFEDVTESFSYRVAQKELELISSIAPETPTLIVGDPGRLRQILRNLIGNALKFTHDGRIVVKVESVQEPGDGIKLRFMVTDTGIGIPQEKQSLVFESFTQADGSTTRKYGGTGLGITISKQLAELMGGEIGLESTEGKGSTFWFTAVFSKQSETDLPNGREIDLVTRHTKIEMDRKNIRILLAEDYPTNQEIAKRHLAHAGYQVDLAENGKLALDAFRLKHYDLILMDIQMPVMDGFQATRAIREIEAKLAAMENTDATKMLHRVPIVAMTAHALSEHKDLCLEAGMDDFLSKPLTRKDLLAIVAKWLNVKSKPATINPVADTGQDIAPQAILPGLPIDLERAINEFEGDRKLVAEVIAGFTKKVSEQLVTMREALACGDAETVRREAHSIKGGAASLTADDLAKVAAELELKGKSKDLSGADKIVHALETKFEALRRYVEENHLREI